VPLPRIAYRLDAYVKAGLSAARDAHAQIFERLDATEIQHRDGAEGAGHIIGTARMGSDPKSSVVDGNLRSHDHSNRFILGSAVFPTSGTAIPH
jgi:choline dehydrogenase-like flavoprotein